MNGKIKVQALLMYAYFDSTLILKITQGKVIVSHQNDNLALIFLSEEHSFLKGGHAVLLPWMCSDYLDKKPGTLLLKYELGILFAWVESENIFTSGISTSTYTSSDRAAFN